jgi:cytochrome c-type biogenesis protein
MFTESISYSAALIAGLLSFFSPCILPLIPAYFVFISGFTVDELTGCENGIRKKVILSTIAYVLGFSSVFILMGASASYLGSFIQIYSTPIRIIGGILIMFLGLHLTGWLRFNALEFEKRVHLDKKPIHFLGTFIVGMAFGAGWSPCIGPLLGSILILAGSKETIGEGVILLGVYSFGLAVPFMVLSVFIDVMLVFLKKATRALQYFNRISGILLILLGLTLVLNKMVLFP